MFTVITKFQHNSKDVELPLLLFFDTSTLLKMLEIIRTFKV
ncbi:hypothetical protein [Pontibacter sp. BAB1700]|nr:hypothetical protein [Pontibacter sp. BAB1700]